MKIIDRIKKQEEKNKKQKKFEAFFSFEFFPPKTTTRIESLYEKIERLIELYPLYIDVTWGAGGSTSEKTLEIATKTQKFLGIETMLHLTCSNMTKEKVDKALSQAKQNGIQNILALRGDPPQGDKEFKAIDSSFQHAIDLVKYIKSSYGDYFGIAVAGYPEGHSEAKSYEEDLQHLKEKVDAGGDFIITQMFFDTNIFLKFVQDCRNIGITCPIIPGIMIVADYAGFKKMADFTKMSVQKEITDKLEKIKDDKVAVTNFGVEVAIDMCKKLINSEVPGLHFYTLNRDNVTKILEGLELIQNCRSRREYPWRKSAHPKRKDENVRPIFWKNNSQGYIHLTDDWEYFPKHFWNTKVQKQQYKEITEDYLKKFYRIEKYEKDLPESINSTEDVSKFFVDYYEGKKDFLPWTLKPLGIGNLIIKEKLLLLSKLGLFVINSQPRINEALSTDDAVGFGGFGGFIYQKRYIEFFISLEKMNILFKYMDQFPNITYHAVNHDGTKIFTNNPENQTTTVCWGAFGCGEIKQPLIVDPICFQTVWKNESFGIWTNVFGQHYQKDSTSFKILQDIHDNYFLMNIIDHDFVTPSQVGRSVWRLFLLLEKELSNENENENEKQI